MVTKAPTAAKAMPDRLWSHVETAEYLGIPATSLHQLNYKGTGPRSYKVGRHRKYSATDVQAWLDAHASDAKPA